MGVVSGSTAALLGMMAITTAATTATSLYSTNQQAKEAKSAREDAARAAANQNLGNLSPEDAQMSASKRMFRQGLYFTSPTGTLSSGARGRSRLMGA